MAILDRRLFNTRNFILAYVLYRMVNGIWKSTPEQIYAYVMHLLSTENASRNIQTLAVPFVFFLLCLYVLDLVGARVKKANEKYENVMAGTEEFQTSEKAEEELVRLRIKAKALEKRLETPQKVD